MKVIYIIHNGILILLLSVMSYSWSETIDELRNIQ